MREKIPRKLFVSSAFVYLFSNILFLLGIPFHIKKIALSLLDSGHYGDIEFFFGPYFIVQIVCLLVASVCTMILAFSRAKNGFPGKYTLPSMIYNCTVMILMVALLNYLNRINLLIPYTVLYIIPFITGIGSLIFLFRDLSVKRRQDKGLAIFETKPMKKDAGKRSTVTAEKSEESADKEDKEKEIKEVQEIPANPLAALTEIANRTVEKEEKKGKGKFVYDKTGNK